MIGNVLEGMIGEKIIKREEIVVVTKVGYLQGLGLQKVKDKEDFEQIFYEDMVKVDNEKHWHCISPKFIEDQLDESLSRLSLQTVDVLMLHNPEHCWRYNETEDIFYSKLKKAFECLEDLVQKGKIQKYGIASNALPTQYKNRFISLEKCIEIAKSIKIDHHFEFIQFPFNFEEPEAYTETHLQNKNLFEFSKENSITTLSSRPFNTYWWNRRKTFRKAQ